MGVLHMHTTCSLLSINGCVHCCTQLSLASPKATSNTNGSVSVLFVIEVFCLL